MNLAELKSLAEQFRAVADDKDAVTKLADDTIATNGHHDTPLKTLCDSYKKAANGAAVRVISDEVKARTA